MLTDKNYIITDKDILKDTHPTLRLRAKKVNQPFDIDVFNVVENLRNYVVKTQIDYRTFLEEEQEKINDELNDKKEIDLIKAPITAIGIAAPQVGISKRILYVCVPFFNEETKKPDIFEKALINPVLYKESVRKCYLQSGEGCLSVVNLFIEGFVQRPYQISIKAYDYFTKSNVDFSATGLMSVVLHHEIDHLKGILFIDYIDKNNQYAHDEDAIAITK